MLTVPLHVSPGLLVVWRGLYTLLPDPEWSLQLLPFVCGIAGIPLMALVVRELTRDNGLAVLAAAVTALNPLLARYSVFVHQYAVEFTMTALFLLAATRLYSGRTSDLDPRRFVGVAFAAGLAPLFSVTSVFISFPLVNLAAAYAIRNWFRDGRRMRATLFGAAVYDAMVFAAYLFLRNRSSPAMRAEFVDHFMPIESVGQALVFLADNGRHLAELSLPGWGTVWMPVFGLGLAWLLSRRATRFLGLVILGFYSARIVASALWVYPLGYDRVEIFTFPVAICLFAASVHAATAAFAKPGTPAACGCGGLRLVRHSPPRGRVVFQRGSQTSGPISLGRRAPSRRRSAVRRRHLPDGVLRILAGCRLCGGEHYPRERGAAGSRSHASSTHERTSRTGAPRPAVP